MFFIFERLYIITVNTGTFKVVFIFTYDLNNSYPNNIERNNLDRYYFHNMTEIISDLFHFFWK